MSDNDIINRIKYLMKELNYRQVDFARKIDVDTSNLSKYLNGRLPVSDALINRLVVNLGVSKQWLEDGTDLPFAKSPTVTALTAPAASPMQGTPVYDIDVTAGSMPRASMWADEHVVGWVNLPNVAHDGCRIVRVSGDSMSPVIQNGDYVAIRELSNQQYIFWGQIYVVILDDYRMLKYVRRNDNPALVTLRSANPDYDDMEIARADIRELMLVQHILHLDTRI
ncbi:MAG: LexA family transcriptional regulator [Muribaculaceae bacterium]|nr:LexA family transcriptional regulator [Muribaculaceae bacterium]